MREQVEELKNELQGSFDYNSRLMPEADSKDRKEYQLENFVLARVIQRLEQVLKEED